MFKLKRLIKNKEIIKSSLSFYDEPRLEEKEGRPFFSDISLIFLVGGIILILF